MRQCHTLLVHQPREWWRVSSEGVSHDVPRRRRVVHSPVLRQLLSPDASEHSETYNTQFLSYLGSRIKDHSCR